MFLKHVDLGIKFRPRVRLSGVETWWCFSLCVFKLWGTEKGDAPAGGTETRGMSVEASAQSRPRKDRLGGGNLVLEIPDPRCKAWWEQRVRSRRT